MLFRSVVDGHARVEEAITAGANVPVLYLDLSEDDERFVLATLDPISALATYDAGILDQLLDGVDITTDELVDYLKKESSAAQDDLSSDDDTANRADALKLLEEVTLEVPSEFIPNEGERWRCGNHVLWCADVMTEWHLWSGDLNEGTIFVPYPGPFIPFTEVAKTKRLLMVQPEPFLAGHLLSRFAEVHGFHTVGVQQDD